MAPVNRPLTTTSHAILGQLAWGGASTYELVKAMRRNLRYMWPRAESRIYDEALRLAEGGLAVARDGRSGRRRHTRYEITDPGREALREWLAREPEGIVLEHGPLLRILLGGEGQPQDLLTAVNATRRHAEEMLTIGAALAREYLDGRHPQQHEVHLRALTFDYLYHWALLNRQWALRTEAEIRRWRDTAPNASKHHRALDRIRDTLSENDSASPRTGVMD